VTDCVEATLPAFFVVENVRQFADWILFPEWRACLVKLGYHVQERVLSATAFGVPQLRNRLIVVGSRKPLALGLPATPGTPPAIGPLLEPTRAWVPFDKAPTDGARARMLDALRRQNNRRCLVQHVTDYGDGVSLDEPIRTITTKAQWVLVDPKGYRQLSLRELARAQGFDDTFRLPADIGVGDGKRLIGNAVPPPLARGVIAAVQEAA
jgi:DNA (cytosine-5)-methyltransferase 1